MSPTPTDYYDDQCYYGGVHDAYGIIADKSPLGHDLLDPNDCFPSTIEELDQEIGYWRELNIVNGQLDAQISNPDILELQRYQCIDGIVNILETISSLPPRSDQRKRFFEALERFEHIQSEWNCRVSFDATDHVTSYSTGSSSPVSYRSSTEEASDAQYHCSEPECIQVFKRYNALQRHISSIHQKPGVFCPFCPAAKRKFNRSDNFQRHVSTRHKNVPNDDEALQRCVRRLYQGSGRRTSWRK
ncbi:hypothetical protein EDC01DRAFT_64697 [Geopyxis carbonaria]|nr:hypothetical protein EDC01DRAFT_64697 [Geopyxis carbonaria]